MGLDMYVYRLKKANLADRVYTSEELRELGLDAVPVEDAEKYANIYAEVLPYVIKREVVRQVYNLEKIIADYNLPSNSRIWMYSYEGIKLCCKDDNGNDVDQYVTRDEISKKYTLTEVIEYYVFKTEEVAYWRKHYDLQDWIYDALGNVENTKYCYLPEEIIEEINTEFNEGIPVEPDLFYWEWY